MSTQAAEFVRESLDASRIDAVNFIADREPVLEEFLGSAFTSIARALWVAAFKPLDDCDDDAVRTFAAAVEPLQVEAWLLLASVGVAADQLDAWTDAWTDMSLDDLEEIEAISDPQDWSREASGRLFEVVDAYAVFEATDDGEDHEAANRLLAAIGRVGSWAVAREVLLRIFVNTRVTRSDEAIASAVRSFKDVTRWEARAAGLDDSYDKQWLVGLRSDGAVVAICPPGLPPHRGLDETVGYFAEWPDLARFRARRLSSARPSALQAVGMRDAMERLPGHEVWIGSRWR